MENFNKLMEIVMSYNLGLREHQGQRYITLEEDITDLVHSEEHIKLRNKAIMELLNLQTDHAYRLIKRFKNIVQEIESDFFKVRDYDSKSTLEQFELVSSLRGVVVRTSHWDENALVTTNFINALENNIWARTFIISQIEDALKSAIEDQLPPPASIFVEDEIINNLTKNPETDRFMDWSIWSEIVNEGKLINTEGFTTKMNKYSKDDFMNYLNAAGRSVFKDIKSYYKGSRPVEVFAVFYAMSELDLIAAENKNLLKLTRKAVANALGMAFEISLSTQIVGYNISVFENRAAKQVERIAAAKAVINRLLKR